MATPRQDVKVCADSIRCYAPVIFGLVISSFIMKYAPAYRHWPTILTFGITCTGVLLRFTHGSALADYLLFFGLFGFAGGISVTGAISFLFYEVPYLHYSGLVPKLARAIGNQAKDAVLDTYFNDRVMEKCVEEWKCGIIPLDCLAARMQIRGGDWVSFDSNLERIWNSLEEKSDSRVRIICATAELFGGKQILLPVIKPLIVLLGEQTTLEYFKSRARDEAKTNAQLVRTEIDALMLEKVDHFAAKRALVKEMFRNEIGWMLLWGNLVGGSIGILIQSLKLVYFGASY